jgi:hypothetical protein
MTITLSATQLVLTVSAPLLIGMGLGAGFVALWVRDELAAIRAEREIIGRWDDRTSTDLMDRLVDPEPEPAAEREVIVPDMHDVYLPEDMPPPAPMPPGLAAALTAALVLEAMTWRYKRQGRHDGRHDPAGRELLLTLLTPTQQLRAISPERAA